MSRRTTERDLNAAPTRKAGALAAAALLLAALTAVAYGQIAELGFVSFDDPQYVSANPVVLRGLSLEGLRYACTSTELGNWHPLTWLSHMLVVELFGPAPGAHHVSNLILHVASVVLLFTWLVRATGSPWPSALAAGLFGLHPLHVESVAWIAERKDVLSTAFLLLALHAWTSWVRAGKPRHFAFALAAFAAGLMSKPMLVTLPVLLLLLDFWPFGRWKGHGETGGRSVSALLREKAPYFALSLACAVAAYFAQSSAGSLRGGESFDLLTRAANAVRSCGVYLLQTVWPADLAVFYPYPPRIPMLEVAAAGLALVALSAACIARFRRAPYLLVGWLWFLVTLAPVLGLIQVGDQAHADRYTYLPHIGLFVAITWGLDEILGLLGSLRVARGIRIGVIALVLGAALYSARAQVRTWRDDQTLFSHALAATKGNYLAHDYLGRALQSRGRASEALEHYRAAIALRPSFASPYVNLGGALESLGQPEAAIESYRRAIEVEPGLAFAHANLGAALGALGRHGEAAEVLAAGLVAAPSDAGLLANAALNDLALGERARAVERFRRALEVEPGLIGHPQALYFAWLMATDPDPACRDGELARRIAVDAVRQSGARAPMSLEALAAAQAELGRFDQAVLEAQQALALSEAAGQQQVAGRLREALALYRAGRPLRIDPR